MIPLNVVQEAEKIADSAMFSNVYLVPINGSALNKLTDTLYSFEDDGSNDDIRNQSINAGSSAGTHNEIENYIVHTLTRVMSSIINAAKNVVNPHCESIINLIQEQRKEQAMRAAGILGEIKSVEVPKLLVDDIFSELIKPYSSTAEKTISGTYDILNFVREHLTTEEIAQLIKTGSPNVDNKIDEYLPYPDVLSAAGYESIDTSTTTLKQTVYYFLLLTGLQNERNEKTAILTEDPKTRLTISEWRASAAGRIYRDLDAAIREISSGAILVRNSYLINNYYPDTVYVYGINYRKWIQEKGGSPEAVLGIKASGVSLQSLSSNNDLYNNPEEFKQVYNSRLEHAKHVAIMKDLGLVKRVTRDYMTDVINKLDDINYPTFHTRLNEAIEHEYHGANDLVPFVIKCVSRTLFPAPADANDKTRSDVKDLLLEVHAILTNDSEVKLDHAIYLATVRLSAKYVSRMIRKETI